VLKRAALLLALSAAALSAQTAPRRAANIAALLAYPGFYHLRPVVVIGTVAPVDGRLHVMDEGGAIHLVAPGRVPEGLDEVRGEFWDLGRMKPDDPQLAGRDLQAAFGIDPEGAWPRPGETTAIVATAVDAAPPSTGASIRAIALRPSQYRDQRVTVTGQFSGRNLYGELPDAPGRSRWDFVVRSADAALWVTGVEPKGKDGGRDFELGLDARLDTNRWLQVSGTVRQRRGLIWIEGDAGSLSLARPLLQTPIEEPVRIPPGPAPEVVFSAPTENEQDVPPATSIRIQFSRDIDQATFKDHIRVSYDEAAGAGTAEPAAASADFTTQYDTARRVLELRFARPLERFRRLKVELQEGITGTDQQPLKPWTLTFTLGGG
jgi:hypothetical protein